MGNKGSQFETQFHKRYSFIQSMDDKLFGLVKIYRKNTVKFDYIMIMEVQLEQLSPDEIQTLQQRLRQARSYQNETTLRIYHFKVLDRASLECRERRLVIYAQYMNRSVFDYLCALRSNPKFVFEVSEIVYVVKNVAKGCIALKRMGITNPDLSSTRIFLSPQGEALLCPLLYILESLRGTTSYNQIQNLQNRYQKYSIASMTPFTLQSTFSLKQQLINLLLQMTGNLSQRKIQQTTFIYRTIQQSNNIESLYAQLPEVETETMKIQQMQRMENIPGEFYEIN